MSVPRWVLWAFGSCAAIASPLSVRADAPPTDEPRVPWVDLLAAGRAGEIGVDAQAADNGRVAVRLSNPTSRRLRVVLPPGLIASGATGQFGAIGGLGGLGFNNFAGFGGVNNFAGVGNFGGLGNFGGVGGFGGGFNGGFANAGGGVVVPQTTTPQQGLSMLGSAIMGSTGHPDSWDRTSLIRGFYPSMGAFGIAPPARINPVAGPGIGGLGFRSIPPTEAPAVVLEPGETRPLLARLVSLGGPSGPKVNLPTAGERLNLLDAGQTGMAPAVRDVLRRLARAKAPETVAQLALWGAMGIPWDLVAQQSRGWANADELALARSVVERSPVAPASVSDRLIVEVVPRDSSLNPLGDEIRSALEGRTLLGLKVDLAPAEKPDGPSVACRVVVNGSGSAPEVMVEVREADPTAPRWRRVGDFPIKLARDLAGRVDPEALGASVSDGLLGQLVEVSLRTAHGSGKSKGKISYAVQVENRSGLILNGIALDGLEASDRKSDKPAPVLVGLGVAPRRSFLVPATADAVERLGWKRGIRVAAVDLSGL